MVGGPRLYVEGGGGRRDLKSECRKAFHILLENVGVQVTDIRIVPSGSRGNAYNSYCKHIARQGHGFTALLVDSEHLVSDIEQVWQHVLKHDKWSKPTNSLDESLYLMTTCMETWIVADDRALAKHFGPRFEAKRLPRSTNLEAIAPPIVLNSLRSASRNCSVRYEKGIASFNLLARLDVDTLRLKLPSFRRMVRILQSQL